MAVIAYAAYAAYFSVDAKLRRMVDDEPPFYFLGETFDGLELTHVSPPLRVHFAEFNYGECDRQDASVVPPSSGWCGYPIAVAVREVDPSEQMISGPMNPERSCTRVVIRGAPAALWGPPDPQLDVYVALTEVSIWGIPGPSRERLMGAGNALRRVGEARPAALPRPPYDVEAWFRALGCT